jgi:hypothetical protein
MVRRPTSCRRLRPLKAHLSRIERIDKHVDHANRVDMPQRSRAERRAGELLSELGESRRGHQTTKVSSLTTN